MTKPEIIFFGNGPLAKYTLSVLESSCDILFHAKEKVDLDTVKALKKSHPNAFGVLASYGVIIKSDVLDLFEPIGILNLHPSLLPKYRGPSPIETAIKNGDTTFGVSIMKLAPAMDAGPIYYQTSLEFPLDTSKDSIYQSLGEAGATWLLEHLANLPTPSPQDDSHATYTEKLDKSMSALDPAKNTALELSNRIRAFADFPKSKLEIRDLDCTIIKAHPESSEFTPDERTFVVNFTSKKIGKPTKLSLCCRNNTYLTIDEIQPAGRKIMDAKSFVNGYLK